MNYADRVKDTSASVGTGPITLFGAPITGFRSFLSVFPSGAVDVPYVIDDGEGNWEIGIGSFADSVLTRTQVLSSSSNGGLVDFVAGKKSVICTLPADLVESATNRSIAAASESAGHAVQTAQDRAQTAIDKAATAEDRMQTGADASAASSAKGAAELAASSASVSANAASLGAETSTAKAVEASASAAMASTKAALLGSAAVVVAAGPIALAAESAVYQLINPNGAARDVTLPNLTAADAGRPFVVKNTGTAGNAITLKNAAAAVIGPLIANGYSSAVVWTGTGWEAI